MDEIKNIVKKVIGNVSPRRQRENEAIHEFWKGVLKDQELLHSKISDYKENQLIVNVDSSAWLFQFNLRRQKILKDLNKDLPKIKNINFRIGKIQ